MSFPLSARGSPATGPAGISDWRASGWQRDKGGPLMTAGGRGSMYDRHFQYSFARRSRELGAAARVRERAPVSVVAFGCLTQPPTQTHTSSSASPRPHKHPHTGTEQVQRSETHPPASPLPCSVAPLSPTHFIQKSPAGPCHFIQSFYPAPHYVYHPLLSPTPHKHLGARVCTQLSNILRPEHLSHGICRGHVAC